MKNEADNELITKEVVDDPNIAGDEVKFDDPEKDVAPIEADKIDKTKAFSKRLNEKAKEFEDAAQEKLNRVAKAKGFETFDEMEAASEAEQISNLGVKDEVGFKNLIQDVISKDPTVIEARKIIADQKKADTNKLLTSEMAKIHGIDEDINDISDLTKLDNYDALYEKVEKGYSLYDAYVLTSMDKLSTKKIDAAQRDVINKINGKNHLKKISGNRGETLKVPADTMKIYKRNMPNMSDEDIVKHYNETMNEGSDK